MMRARALTLLTTMFAALTLATPAVAQLATGRSGSSTTSYMSGEEYWNEVVTFGRCYAKRNTEYALMLIATDPGSRDEVAVYRELFRNPSQSCLSRGIAGFSAPHQFMRGSIAEGLYYGRVSVPPAMLLTAPEPGAVRDLSGAARCYVKANEAEARALGETDPGSRKEEALMGSVVQNFMKCMPAGVPLNYPSTMIRFRIVEAMFRMGITRAEAAGN